MLNGVGHGDKKSPPMWGLIAVENATPSAGRTSLLREALGPRHLGLHV